MLSKITMLLESKAKIYTFQQLEETYNRVDIYSIHSHKLLLDYLIKFPNLGNKNISICIWRKMHDRQDRKEHLTISGLQN